MPVHYINNGSGRDAYIYDKGAVYDRPNSYIAYAEVLRDEPIKYTPKRQVRSELRNKSVPPRSTKNSYIGMPKLFP